MLFRSRRPDLAQTLQWRYRTTDGRSLPLRGQRVSGGHFRFRPTPSLTGALPLLLEPGGSLRTERLAELVATAGGLEGMVRGLSNTHYGPVLATGWQRYQAGEGIAALERELERWQAEHAAAMFRRDPLSIAISIGYLGCKEVEGTNLRLVAQAVGLNSAREQARRDLILV